MSGLIIFIIILYIFHDNLLSHKDDVFKTADLLNNMIKKIEDLNIKNKKEVIKNLKYTSSLLKLSVNERVITLTKLLDIVNVEKAVIKKKWTLSFNKMLHRDTVLDDDEIYHLTYIFNRFLGELLDDDVIKSFINLGLRLYKFAITHGKTH